MDPANSGIPDSNRDIIGIDYIKLVPIIPTGSPWPMFAHDRQHTGQSPYVGPQSATTKWRLTTIGRGIFTSPTISQGQTAYIVTSYAFLPNDATNIHAINPDGSEKWRVGIGKYDNSNNHSSPSIAVDGTIYVGSSYREDKDKWLFKGILYAINPDGTIKWTFNAGEESWNVEMSSPLIGLDGTIYIAAHGPAWSTVNYLYAIRSDGTEKWRIPIGSNDETRAAPALSRSGDTIYVTSRQTLYAVVSDGREKWKFEVPQPPQTLYSSPSIGADETIYVGGYYLVGLEGKPILYAIHPDGTLKWSFNPKKNGIFFESAISIDGTIYAPGGGIFYAINSDGSLKWEFSETANTFGTIPAIGADRTIYASASTYKQPGYVVTLFAINPDGTEKFRTATEEIGDFGNFSSPSIAEDSTLYFGAGGGATRQAARLYALGKKP